jgi:ADP-ribose pyrophosphatase
METWQGSKIIFSGKIFSIRTGSVLLDDGSMAKREVVEHPGGVAVVPIIDYDILLIRQFRISIGREIIELPAGRFEQGDTPELRAQLELAEELGYYAEKLILTNSYYSSVGFTNEKMFIFLGLNLKPAEKPLEWDERIQAVKVPISKIESMLLNNEFEDSKTIIGLHATLSYLHGHPQVLDP